jgi:iron complex outermembrane receptor protein
MRRIRIFSAALLSGQLSIALSTAAETEAPPPAESPRDAHHAEEASDHEPEEIVVTGHPLEHDKDELALPVDVLDRTQILDQAGATLGETLATHPGIATSGFTGGASRPVIRGQDAFRTGVAEDGLPTQDVSRESPDHAVPVNPIAIERIEVVRGPATLRYGGGASAGVVNAITKRVPDERPESAVSGGVFGAVDSVANRRDIDANLDGGVGPVAWHLDGLLRDTDDYEIPTGGTQKGTFADAFSGSAGASYFFGKKGRFGASYTRFESDYGIPEEDEDAHIDLHSDRARFEGDWSEPAAGISELRVRGAYSDYRHEEIADGIVGQTFDLDQFDGRLELVHDEFWGLHGAIGVTGESRDLKAGGEAAEFLAPTQTTQAAFYVFEERELAPALVGEFGFRVEGPMVDGTPAGATTERHRSFLPVSGSMGLVYEATELLSFGLTGAASQRAPAESELYARGPHEASGTFEIGDPNLDEETSYTGELRMTYDDERVRADVAGFVTHYEDFIFAQLTGASVDEAGDPAPPGDPDALDLLFYRPRNARFAGVEVSSEVDLLEALAGSFGIDGQFDYVRARFTSGTDRNVPRIPPIRWGAGLFYRGDRVRGRVGFLRTQAQNHASHFETNTSAYTFLNAQISVQLTPFGAAVPVELSIYGTNLTNQRGRNHVSFLKNELLLPGVNVRGAVRVDF